MPESDRNAAPRLEPHEWQRIGVILILAFIGNIAFWTAFEQAGSSMNVFAAQSTDRTLWGLLDEPFPASWYQAANPAAVIVFAPSSGVMIVAAPWMRSMSPPAFATPSTLAGDPAPTSPST